MAVTAPVADKYGALIDARIAALQALVTANANPLVEYQIQQELNQAQVEAVDHYMVTGWLNAGSNVLATYAAPAWDSVGQALTARVADLQNLVNNPPTMPPGNNAGYGDSGWTTIKAAYEQMLYAAQITLVEHLMALPGGTSAATMLANLTGVQTDPAGIPYAYVFSSVGFTDVAIE